MFDWKEYIEKKEAQGYNLLWAGKCPHCGAKAVQIHNGGVIHGKCESCHWNCTGFGGPSVMSWSEAVTNGNLSKEVREARKEKQMQ